MSSAVFWREVCGEQKPPGIRNAIARIATVQTDSSANTLNKSVLHFLSLHLFNLVNYGHHKTTGRTVTSDYTADPLQLTPQLNHCGKLLVHTLYNCTSFGHVDL
jgi:hypothetical protein